MAKPKRKSAGAAPKPPKTYDDFVARFPDLSRAWDAMGAAARAAGPLDDRECRLVKLGIAIGAQHVGAVSAAVRQARAAGVSVDEIEQAAALAASTVGAPGAVAAWSWIRKSLRG
jgi:alkylhydroperoxidase/carboxymuconolactone decarboxylase family protein YurZ